MSQTISFNIYVMSYHRADSILTKHCFNNCTYVVRASEEQAYRDAGIEDMLVIPENATLKCGASVDCFSATFHWIVENSPEDVVVIIDDDVQSYKYRRDVAIDIFKEYKNPKDVVEDELMRMAQILVDLNLGMLFTQPAYQLYNYTQEYCFKGMIGSTRIVNKAAWRVKYDSEDFCMSDIDMVYQELLKNRIILQPRYFHSITPEMFTNGGGTSYQSEVLNQFRLAMKNKWGKYYDYDVKKSQAKINVNR